MIELLSDKEKRVIKIYLELKSRKDFSEHKKEMHSKRQKLADEVSKGNKKLLEEDAKFLRFVLDLEELEDAFDHIIYCMADEFSEEPKGSEYQKEQLNNAIKHIEKSTYDFLDVLDILISKKIERIYSFQSDVIAIVFPEYYREYTKKMRNAKEDIISYRYERSFENIEKYFSIIKTMDEINQKIEIHLPDMIDIQKEKKKYFILRKILTPFIIKLIVGLILLVIGVFIGK